MGDLTNADSIEPFGSTPERRAPFASAAVMAMSLAPFANAGHFDELRGAVAEHPPAASLLQGLNQGQSQSQTQSQTDSRFQSEGKSQSALSSTLGSSSQNSGTANDQAAPDMHPYWESFFDFLGASGFADLNQRTLNLKRQIRDNGVTYNVYADANGPQRPWSIDLLPLIVSPSDWASIEAGIRQRTRLLNSIMADVYGPQHLLSRGLLPAALVQGHPGYLRAMQGVQPAGGLFLHIAAFDLAHGPDGKWSVVSQRTQAPSGLGYLLENRLSISMLFPEAFRGMRVLRLADSYKALVDSMKALSQQTDSRIVLLTSGPYNETYFEHAYLARYLGLTLVEGKDLLVRHEQLFLKTLQGLEPVHGVLKRLDDEFLDPLELRADSTLGVPGLLQVIRAGNVQVANAPGSAFLESSAILGFLPALSEALLGETLSLPSTSTWWCGEQAVMQSMLQQLKNCVIKPTYPATGMASVLGHTLNQRGLDEWAGRIVRGGSDYTVQAYVPLSQTPTWQNDGLAPRSTMLRVFALPDGHGSWRVLPGGLARLAGKDNNIASMQYGGSSADVWVLGAAKAGVRLTDSMALAETKPQPPHDALRQEMAATTVTAATATAGTALVAPATSAALPHRHEIGRKQPVTSRAAENLFWLGRYSERAENSLRLAQLTLHSLAGDEQLSAPLLAWVSALAVSNSLVLSSVPPATQARRVFERSLIAALPNTDENASVGYNLVALKTAASAVRERLSQEQWHVIVQMERDFFKHCHTFTKPVPDYSVAAALSTLDATSNYLAAITGAQTDRMMRDDGWRLLSIGRHIERLGTLSGALAKAFTTQAVADDSGFSAVVALFDSTITFHAQYQQRRDTPALLDLLVLDQDNPRSLSWVLKSLKNGLAKLIGNTTANSAAADTTLQHIATNELPELAGALQHAAQRGDQELLIATFERCKLCSLKLSDELSQRYFSHANSRHFNPHSVGAGV